MPTDLPMKTRAERKLSVANLLFPAFYLTCFVIMAVYSVPLMSDAFTMASP